MQYYDQREKTLKRIIKTIVIFLVTILCIAGILFLVNMIKSEQNTLSISEQQEQQLMVTLRPLYEEKSKLEKQLSDISYKRNHSTARSQVVIPLLTDCSKALVLEFAAMFQPYDYPAIICISDTLYPGAEGCISIKEAKELVNRRWEFILDISSDIDGLTKLLQSSGLTKPVAVYNPSSINSIDSSLDLPLIYYGNQSSDTLFSGVFGMQTDEFLDALYFGSISQKNVVMTVGTVLPREKYDKALLQDILNSKDTTENGQKSKVCNYSENATLQANYKQQQQKVIDETEAEYQSISEALRNVEEQIEKIETDEFANESL